MPQLVLPAQILVCKGWSCFSPPGKRLGPLVPCSLLTRCAPDLLKHGNLLASYGESQNPVYGSMGVELRAVGETVPGKEEVLITMI